MHFSLCVIRESYPSQLERHPKIFELVHFHFFSLLFHLMHPFTHKHPSCVGCCPLVIGVQCVLLQLYIYLYNIDGCLIWRPTMVLPYITDFTLLTKMGQTSTHVVNQVEHASRHSLLSAYKAIRKPRALFENFRLP